MKIFRVILNNNEEQTKGLFTEAKNLFETLKELKEIKELSPEKLDEMKDAELKQIKEDIDNMSIEIADYTYKGMFRIKDVLKLNENELQAQVNDWIKEYK